MASMSYAMTLMKYEVINQVHCCIILQHVQNTDASSVSTLHCMSCSEMHCVSSFHSCFIISNYLISFMSHVSLNNYDTFVYARCALALAASDNEWLISANCLSLIPLILLMPFTTSRVFCI